MTMHLLGPAYTTTHTGKRNKKATPSSHTKMGMDWLDHRRQCKRLGITAKTFDEYIQYRKGNYNPKLRGTKMPEYNVSNHREKYPSLADTGVTFAKKPNVYTGDRLLGIATMHKSNAVPVIDEEQMKDISRMRRG